MTWFGPTRFLQKALPEPLLHVGNFHSNFYHDVVYWPLVESRIYEKWLKDSQWGDSSESTKRKVLWRRVKGGICCCPEGNYDHTLLRTKYC